MAHGIGIYNGIIPLTKNGLKKDYIQILYDENDKIYIPVEKISTIFKYIGKEGSSLKLDKLNSTSWAKKKRELRNKIKDISNELSLKDYIDSRYNESLSKVEFLESDTENNKTHRKLIYLTSNWFMQTLLDRTDRMSMYNGFEVRVPFCDYRIVEYMWNIPWEMKAYKGREKGLLRHCMEDFLPQEIVYRKKSPYPKTHNPNYLKIVKEKLYKIVSDSESPINNLLNKKYILDIIATDGKAFTRPWFGQLMTGPQLMAYLIQVNIWLERYNPTLEI